MNVKPLSKLNACLLAATLFTAVNSFADYAQNATNVFAPGPNVIEKSATNTYTTATFQSDVAQAWNNNSGGVFNFPTGVATATTIYRAVYGTNTSSGKRMQMTSSVSMQNITTSSTSFTVASAANATTSSANQNDYNLTLSLVDNGGSPLPNEAIQKVGFIILSRGGTANYPLSLQVTATFSDLSTQAITAPIAAGSAADDTFFGFAAPSGTAITKIRFQSFAPNTTTPVTDRIAFDDFGFITGPSVVIPQPLIQNVTPAAFAQSAATNGIQFSALTYETANLTNISLTVNSNDVTSQLVFTGSPTNYTVSYYGLIPDQQYTMTINVTNSTGTKSLTRTFYTATSAFTLFDSQGFTDDTKYPVGNLLSMTNGQTIWTPNALEPAQIVDTGTPTYGKVLQRQNTGATRADTVSFPGLSSGTLFIEFDAFISTAAGRTLDVALLPTAGSTMASLVGWGDTNNVPGKFDYFDNVVWQPLSDIITDWQHVKIINYLSGPAAGKYDVLINGAAVAQRLAWRNATVGTAFNQLRIESANTGPIFEYGEIDNLVITAGPTDTNAFPPPQISSLSVTNFSVIKATNGFHFNLSSGLPLSASNVAVTLDGTDISSSLVLTGPSTNLLVSYNLLGTGLHTLSIVSSSASGSNTLAATFIATAGPFTLFDSGGFTSDTDYPLGALQTNAIWTPAATDPGLIVDLGSPQGKVLRRTVQTAADRLDYLKIPQLVSGVLTVDADIRVSAIDSRVLDFGPVQTTGNNTASFLGWGIVSNYFAYYNTASAAWLALSLTDTNWHHYTTVNYLSGPFAETFDLFVDGIQLGTRLPFKNNTSPVGRLRIGAIRGTSSGQYSDIDNLVLTVQTFVPPPNPITLKVSAHATGSVSLSFQSQSGFTHVLETKNLITDSWSPALTFTGDDTIKTISDSTIGGAKYYRLRTY